MYWYWSTGALLVLAILQVWLVVRLAKAIGTFYQRIGEQGALVTAAGPAIGSRLPVMEVVTEQGDAVSLWTPGRQTLLLFVSGRCPLCKDVQRGLPSLLKHETDLSVRILTYDEEELDRPPVSAVPVMRNSRVLKELSIWQFPFAVLVGPTGTVSGKGLVNSLSHVESLLFAAETAFDYKAQVVPSES